MMMFVPAPTTPVIKLYLNRLSLVMKLDFPTPMLVKNRRMAKSESNTPLGRNSSPKRSTIMGSATR